MPETHNNNQLEINGIYRNRVYPDRVVKITEIEDDVVMFEFLEGLPEDYPRKGLTHKLPSRQFSRYYLKEN